MNKMFKICTCWKRSKRSSWKDYLVKPFWCKDEILFFCLPHSLYIISDEWKHMLEPENMAVSQLGLWILCAWDYNEPTLTVIPLSLVFKLSNGEVCCSGILRSPKSDHALCHSLIIHGDQAVSTGKSSILKMYLFLFFILMCPYRCPVFSRLASVRMRARSVGSSLSPSPRIAGRLLAGSALGWRLSLSLLGLEPVPPELWMEM